MTMTMTMNDRFLFRGKRLDNGEWVQGGLSWFNNGSGSYFIACHWGLEKKYPDDIEVDPATIGQCTGLKDKNGKLIFEGDICQYETGGICYIYWNDEQANFDLKGVNYGYVSLIFDIYSACRMEIIGNIHDNPELLNR